ncbi:retrovirus-related Pol polyprotein from transposon 17.6 [Trichonephila clavipes]|nr:retrovirus-related Pol polyprotein from transposon 17.6 [Trichonephila clavipes]
MAPPSPLAVTPLVGIIRIIILLRLSREQDKASIVVEALDPGAPPDNPEAYRFAMDYRKLKAITKYPRSHLPLIDDLITNILHTTIMSSLDLRSGYFQLAVKPSDVVKTAFVTKKGIYAFKRMPFELSGAARHFQNAIDIILKPVIGMTSLSRLHRSLTQSGWNYNGRDKDASTIGIGAILNREQTPVVYASRTLSSAERNYTVTERECLAIVWALNNFRTYLGSLPVEVITDHAALTRLTNGKNLSSGMIRWVLKLAEFYIEWKHRSGTQNVVSDVLSRNPVETRRNTKVKHEKWAKYYNKRRRDVRIKVNDRVQVKTHPLSSTAQKVVAKFKPKFECPYRVLEVKHNNLVVWRAGKRLTVNVDQVRLYHQRKSDENEIRVGSSDSNGSRYKSSSFKSAQPISNESQYSRNNGSGKRREVREKVAGFKGNQGERHTGTASKRGPIIRSSSRNRKLWGTRARSTLDLEDQRGNKERFQNIRLIKEN